MTTFSRTDSSQLRTYQKAGAIDVAPKTLVDLFGPPDEGDGYKVSGEYFFSDAGGNTFALYDWKATSLFDDGFEQTDYELAITPEEFWGNWNPETLHIGCADGADVEPFKKWLLNVCSEKS